MPPSGFRMMETELGICRVVILTPSRANSVRLVRLQGEAIAAASTITKLSPP